MGEAVGSAVVLELTDVTHRFGDRLALDKLSFAVKPGTVVGFLGPNGAGKTTAMRAIFGIVAPTEGTITWNAAPITAAVRRGFGYLPEERGLYPAMKVIDQLVYIGRLHGMRREDARARAGTWLERLGLGDRAGDRLQALSQGNQQRVQVVAAILHGPDLLVLDEPFSGLDPVAVDALGTVLQELASAGAAVLFSSHQLDLVEHLCQEVVIIDHGRLVEAGTVEVLTTERQRLAVEVDGVAPRDWLGAVAGVTAIDNDGRRVRVVLTGASSRDVLAAAQAAGPLVHFGFERRRMSEVFREAVSRR